MIDNRTGAGGNIGADIVAKSAPDGYTLVIGNIGTHAVNVSLFPTMPYDPIKDFTPIVHLLDAEGLLVVNPSLTPTTVPELIALARSQPGKLSYGSGGVGTTSHLAGELFKSMTKVDIVHVPVQRQRAGDHRSAWRTDVDGLCDHADRAAARARRKAAPARRARRPRAHRHCLTLPTVAESVPGFEVSNWIGLFGPAGMPPAIVARLNAEVQKVMRSAGNPEAAGDRGRQVHPDESRAIRDISEGRARQVGEDDQGRQHQGRLTYYQ